MIRGVLQRKEDWYGGQALASPASLRMARVVAACITRGVSRKVEVRERPLDQRRDTQESSICINVDLGNLRSYYKVHKKKKKPSGLGENKKNKEIAAWNVPHAFLVNPPSMGHPSLSSPSPVSLCTGNRAFVSSPHHSSQAMNSLGQGSTSGASIILFVNNTNF